MEEGRDVAVRGVLPAEPTARGQAKRSLSPSGDRPLGTSQIPTAQHVFLLENVPALTSRRGTEPCFCGMALGGGAGGFAAQPTALRTPIHSLGFAWADRRPEG